MLVSEGTCTISGCWRPCAAPDGFHIDCTARYAYDSVYKDMCQAVHQAVGKRICSNAVLLRAFVVQYGGTEVLHLAENKLWWCAVQGLYALGSVC